MQFSGGLPTYRWLALVVLLVCIATLSQMYTRHSRCVSQDGSQRCRRSGALVLRTASSASSAPSTESDTERSAAEAPGTLRPGELPVVTAVEPEAEPDSTPPLAATATAGPAARTIGGGSGTLFTSRVTKRAFFNRAMWSDGGVVERERQERALRDVEVACRAPGPTTAQSYRLTMRGHRELESGRWNRFWVDVECRDASAAAGASWAPCCGRGFHIEIVMESEAAKVFGVRVFELSNAVYEVHVFVRKRGEYRIGASFLGYALPLPWPLNYEEPSDVDGMLARRVMCSALRYPNDTFFENVTIHNGADIVPMNRRCDDRSSFTGAVVVAGGEADDLRDRFRYGAWYRLPGGECDGVHCDGALSDWFVDGWVWATDLCRLQVYSGLETRRILRSKAILAWGTSLLMQPSMNLMYYHVGKDMARMSTHDGFGYDVVWPPPGGASEDRLATVELHYRPATCLNNVVRRSDCQSRAKVGFPTWKRAREDFLQGVYDVVLVERNMWIPHPLNETEYMQDLGDWLVEFRKDLNATEKKPAHVVTMTGTMRENSQRVKSCGYVALVTIHRSWLVEDFFAQRASDVITVINRLDITMPLHFTTQFVHTGTHYGSSPYLCSLNRIRRNGTDPRYNDENCVRSIRADEALQMLWLNVFSTAT